MTIFFGKRQTKSKSKRTETPRYTHAKTEYLNNRPGATSQALVCSPGPRMPPAPLCPPSFAQPQWTLAQGQQQLQGSTAPPLYSPYQPPRPIDGRVRPDLKSQSMSNLPLILSGDLGTVTKSASEWHCKSTDYLNRGAALCDLISSKFDSILTSIDGEKFSGDERELVVYQIPSLEMRGGGASGMREMSRGANNAVSTALTSTNYFSKVNLYANSRLPPNLPTLKLYIPTYPLLCLAAQYSQRVYTRPSGAERETQVDADWRLGTKAMVIKSVPLDHMNTVVFAIRGSQTFMDWAVNLNSAPTSPTEFLDDAGNLCHSGFLSVARKMIKPVAARLRTMLEEDPSRAACSLLITGHSAGGAVASLLYAHMFSKTVESELNILTGCFKRVHCITFGTPPISLLPLQKPTEHRLRNSLFISFINEGDPVPRADKAYVRSLLNLYSTPAPDQSCCLPLPKPAQSTTALTPWKRPKPTKSTAATSLTKFAWRVPPATLSNAGRLALLRSVKRNGEPGRIEDEQILACATNDQQLRGVVFGDPVMHMMKVYARRIEILATNAVLGKGFG